MGKSIIKKNIEAKVAWRYLKELSKLAKKMPVQVFERNLLLASKLEYSDEAWINLFRRSAFAYDSSSTIGQLLIVLGRIIYFNLWIKDFDVFSLNLADSLVMARQYQRDFEQIAGQFSKLGAEYLRNRQRFYDEAKRRSLHQMEVAKNLHENWKLLDVDCRQIERIASHAASELGKVALAILKISCSNEEAMPAELKAECDNMDVDCLTKAIELRRKLLPARALVENSFGDQVFKIRSEFDENFSPCYVRLKEQLATHDKLLDEASAALADLC